MNDTYFNAETNKTSGPAEPSVRLGFAVQRNGGLTNLWMGHVILVAITGTIIPVPYHLVHATGTLLKMDWQKFTDIWHSNELQGLEYKDNVQVE